MQKKSLSASYFSSPGLVLYSIVYIHATEESKSPSETSWKVNAVELNKPLYSLHLEVESN